MASWEGEARWADSSQWPGQMAQLETSITYHKHMSYYHSKSMKYMLTQGTAVEDGMGIQQHRCNSITWPNMLSQEQRTVKLVETIGLWVDQIYAGYLSQLFDIKMIGLCFQPVFGLVDFGVSSSTIVSGTSSSSPALKSWTGGTCTSAGLAEDALDEVVLTSLPVSDMCRFGSGVTVDPLCEAAPKGLL